MYGGRRNDCQLFKTVGPARAKRLSLKIVHVQGTGKGAGCLKTGDSSHPNLTKGAIIEQAPGLVHEPSSALEQHIILLSSMQMSTSNMKHCKIRMMKRVH